MKGRREGVDSEGEGDECTVVASAEKADESCHDGTSSKDGTGNSESKQDFPREIKTAEGSRETAGAVMFVCSTESTSPVRSKNILSSFRDNVEEAYSNEGTRREVLEAGIIAVDDDDDDDDEVNALKEFSPAIESVCGLNPE